MMDGLHIFTFNSLSFKISLEHEMFAKNSIKYLHVSVLLEPLSPVNAIMLFF